MVSWGLWYLKEERRGIYSIQANLSGYPSTPETPFLKRQGMDFGQKRPSVKRLGKDLLG